MEYRLQHLVIPFLKRDGQDIKQFLFSTMLRTTRHFSGCSSGSRYELVTWRRAESQYARWLESANRKATENAYISERQEGVCIINLLIYPAP